MESVLSENAKKVTSANKSRAKRDIRNSYCCVPSCRASSRYDPTLHFHRLPGDPNVKAKWIEGITRNGLSPVKIIDSSIICSKHFTSEDYCNWTPVRKRLNKGAVPTIFHDSQWTDTGSVHRRRRRRHGASFLTGTDSSHDLSVDQDTDQSSGQWEEESVHISPYTTHPLPRQFAMDSPTYLSVLPSPGLDVDCTIASSGMKPSFQHGIDQGVTECNSITSKRTNVEEDLLATECQVGKDVTGLSRGNDHCFEDVDIKSCVGNGVQEQYYSTKNIVSSANMHNNRNNAVGDVYAKDAHCPKFQHMHIPSQGVIKSDSKVKKKRSLEGLITNLWNKHAV